jgi:serine/threonine protein kinase
MSESKPNMSSPHDREEALFQAASQLNGAERAAFLKGACLGNDALHDRLEALLAAHDAPDELSQQNKPAAVTTVKLEPADAPDEAVGQTLGRYKLLERVGEGGCGVVYVAEQTEPVRRRVALKVIKLGMDTKAVVARFEAERQALAMMDHPNIAKVLDAGTTETGRPYFVMELVRGIRITDYCDQSQLSTKERLELFIKVCQAIQHAHQKGIIHRDIKPSNILVTLHDGVPVPKVIDFGIAKATEGRLTEATVYTQLHQFIGTPAYMSPEQAEMSGLDVDTRSDIYSLGVLLYELLAGSTPFDGQELMSQGIDAMRKTIREKEPPRPSTRLATLKGEELTTTAKQRSADKGKLMHDLKGDLDWIVMRCLEKDRTRRYDTATGLAADIKRHLNNEPVVARPPSTAYRFQKAFRRNKLSFLAGAAVAVALVLGIIASTWQSVRATRAKHEAMSAREAAVASEQKALAAQANEVKLREQADSARQRAEFAEHEQGRLRVEAELARKNEHEMRVQTGEEMNNVGISFLRDGNLEAAEVTLRKAFALHRKLLSNEDGNTVMAAGNLAIVLAKQGRQEEAAQLIDELLPAGAEARLENYGLFCFRAQYRVNCNLFRAAAGDMEKAVRLKPDDGLAWLRWAVTLIKGGDFDGYNRLRDEMLSRFGKTPDRLLAEQTAKTCLLLPWSGEKLASAVRLAETAATQSAGDKWAALAKGLGAYRQKQLTQAIECERAAIAVGGADATLEVAARALISMAQAEAGQPQESRKTLLETREIARTRMTGLSPLTPFEENWHNILVADLLLHEATSLIPQ